jgi:predicted O-methyltransferase YrrM
MQAKIERAEHRKSYMTAAREIGKTGVVTEDFSTDTRMAMAADLIGRMSRPRDPRVATRYRAASEQGDMKDFVGWMRKHAKGNVVEIGVRDGASTSAFLAGVEENGGHVYSIDVQPCGHLFEGHPQWSFLQANSTDVDAMCKFIPFEIDLILIDGDHSRAGVLNDIEYCRQLRTGGMVLFHDIAPEERPSGCSDMSWPGDDVKNVYTALCNSMVPLGWTHMELPGKYGLGVLKKPEAVPVKLPKITPDQVEEFVKEFDWK